LLWRRGDSLEQTHARLAALAPDASARRAPRDPVHPLLAEVEKLIPRLARQEFSLFMWAGWLDAKLVELPREQAANAITRRRFAEQWSESNPRFRAAHAVASYLEGEGIAPLSAGGTVYSDEREMLDADRDYWQPRVNEGQLPPPSHGSPSFAASRLSRRRRPRIVQRPAVRLLPYPWQRQRAACLLVPR
jgi:hypothetical protein